MRQRILVLVLLVCLVGLCYGSPTAPNVTDIESARQLQKAESADCGAVKHLARAEDKCGFVIEHCAGGTAVKAPTLQICHSAAPCFPTTLPMRMSEVGAASLHSISETSCAGSIISYVKLYFCNVKPAGSVAVFFYQVRMQRISKHGTAKALTW